MKKPYPFHLLFFSAYPVFLLYSVNYDRTPLADVLSSLGVTLAVAGVLWGLFTFAFKDSSRGAILTSLVLFWFFSAGHIHSYIYYSSEIGHSLGRFRYFLPLWTALGGVGSWLLLRERFRKQKPIFVQIANLVGAVLVISALPGITAGILRKQATEIPDSLKVSENGSGGESHPDIYYILPDAYVRSDVLKEAYGYDNQPFIDYLTAKGFSVPSESCSNYAYTSLSLPSTLNMDYLQNLRDANLLDTQQHLVLDSAVAGFLESRGYQLVYIDTTGKLTIGRYREDDLRRSLHGRFWIMLLSTTAAKPLASIIRIKQHRSAVLDGFRSLKKAIDIPGPKFVFGHILCPHPPFVFQADGGEVFLDNVDPRLGKGGSLEELYAGQVAYVNRRLKELVGRIIGRSKTPPVIIIQADHGSGFIHEFYIFLEKAPSDEFLRRQMSIFSAYLLPGESEKGIYDSITPVNTFRVLFNQCFQAEIPLLEDRCFYSGKNSPGVFLDVTERIRTGS